MNIENMTQENVDFLKKTIETMKGENEDLKYTVYPMSERTDSDILKKILEKVEKIENKLENIFGSQVFINGKMIEIMKKEQK